MTRATQDKRPKGEATPHTGSDLRQRAILALNFKAKSNQTFLAGLCLAYTLIAIVLAPAAYAKLFVYYLGTTAFVMPVVVYPFFAVRAFITQPEKPFQHAHRQIGQRLVPALVIAFVFVLAMSAFTTFKIQLPEFVPFYADQLFADMDIAIHGQDPWRLTHAIVAHPVGDALLYFLYSKIWFFQWFGTILLVSFWHNKQARENYLWVSVLTIIICGTFLAYGLSSAGPLFFDRLYGGERFAPLVVSLQASPGIADVTKVADYLFYIHTQKTADLGGGISAMPSVHVAVVVLNAWFFTSLNRWAGLTAWGFAGIILFTSVHTGWHYAVDGYFSFLVATAVWFTGRYITYKKAPPNEMPGRAS